MGKSVPRVTIPAKALHETPNSWKATKETQESRVGRVACVRFTPVAIIKAGNKGDILQLISFLRLTVERDMRTYTHRIGK